MNNKRNLKRTYILSTIGTIALIANPFQCFANNEIIRVVSTYDPFRTIEVVPYDDSDFGAYDPYGHDDSNSEDSVSTYYDEDESYADTNEEDICKDGFRLRIGFHRCQLFQKWQIPIRKSKMVPLLT